MSDEIKEILDSLKPKYDIVDELGNDYKKVKFKDCKILLDYITNLQEEIKRQEDNYKVMQEDITEVGKLLGLRDDFIISEEMPEKIKELQEEKEVIKNEYRVY